LVRKKRKKVGSLNKGGQESARLGGGKPIWRRNKEEKKRKKKNASRGLGKYIVTQ